MGYNIHVPADWLVVGNRIGIIESRYITGDEVDTPYWNTIKGFDRGGFYYQHCGQTPVYYASFDDIGRLVFETVDDAKRYLATHPTK